MLWITLDCSNEGEQQSHLMKYAKECKNYTAGEPSIIVVDGSGRLGNQIWNYVFMLAVKVKYIIITICMKRMGYTIDFHCNIHFRKLNNFSIPAQVWLQCVRRSTLSWYISSFFQEFDHTYCRRPFMWVWWCSKFIQVRKYIVL